MSRLQNAPTFELKSLVGKRVAEIIAATDSEADELIEILFLKLVNQNKWNRIFLDAGIGFWEKMTKERAFYDYEDYRLIDFSARWQLDGAKFIVAQCIGGTDDITCSSFKLVMDVGTLTFGYVDSQNMESDTVIRFTPDIKAERILVH